MRRCVRPVVIVSVVVSLVGCGPVPAADGKRAQCERLRDHLVELRMETVTAG